MASNNPYRDAVDETQVYVATMDDDGSFTGTAADFASRFQTSIYSAALWASGKTPLRKHGIRKVVTYNG